MSEPPSVALPGLAIATGVSPWPNPNGSTALAANVGLCQALRFRRAVRDGCTPLLPATAAWLAIA